MTTPTSLLEIWVYLSASPLLALLITLAAYRFGLLVYRWSHLNPLANPVAIAVILVASLIQLIHMPYAQYFLGAQFIHFLLGSATVALGVPIYQALASLKDRVVSLLAALFAGGLASIISGVWISRSLGAGDAIAQVFATKSITTPIAMGIAERINVSPTLAAVFAVSTGILGSVIAPYLLNFLRVTAWWQRGFCIGVAAHGIGTSRAFSINSEAGTYAGLAMGLHGVLGAILIPLIWKWLS